MTNERAAVVLLLLAGGVLLLGIPTGGPVEDGDGDPLGGWSPDAIVDNLTTFYNQATEQTPMTDTDVASANEAAWIATIGQAEGADYSTCYGYSHTITDFSDHPAVTGEWTGSKLSDAMCKNAGFGPGCISTAAGKGQITKGTWLRVKAKLGLPDFSPASQDAAILQLTSERGALAAVQNGDVATAVSRCRNEWASLPGNYAGQGQRSVTDLQGWFAAAGGTVVA